jgi:CTP synthase (UTP-ammonia lyase)
VRNVLGFRDADHQESNPDASRFAVIALSCSLDGQQQEVDVVPGTAAADLYGRAQVVEPFVCNYGINPEYAQMFEEHGLVISGRSPDSEVRIVELPSHPFFMAALFVPQMNSTAEKPHPLIEAFVSAARRRAELGAAR